MAQFSHLLKFGWLCCLSLGLLPRSLWAISANSPYAVAASLEFNLMPQSTINDHYQNSQNLFAEQYNFQPLDLQQQNYGFGGSLAFQWNRSYRQFFSASVDIRSDLTGGFSARSPDDLETFSNEISLSLYSLFFGAGIYLFKTEWFYLSAEAGINVSLGELFFNETVTSNIFEGNRQNKNSLLSLGGGLTGSIKLTWRLQNTNGILLAVQAGFVYLGEFTGTNAFDQDIVLTKGVLDNNSKTEVLLLTPNENFNANIQQKVTILQPYAAFALGFWQSL